MKGWKRKTLRNKDIVNEYKKLHPCTICGEDRLVCLDFHHVDDNKIDGVAVLVYKHVSVKRLIQEIDKCIVVCSNCHRIIHANDI